MEQIVISMMVLAAVGGVAGVLAGLLGIGGGTVLVPALVWYGHAFYEGRISDDIIMHMALGTSMAIIIPTGLSSAWAQIKRKTVEWEVLKRLVPGLLIGVVLGVVLAAHLGSAALQMIFAVGMYALSVLIAKEPHPDHTYPQLLNWKIAVPTTSGVGVLATLMGIGGSILNIPYMIFTGVSLHRAIATGSVLGIIVSIPAAVGFMLAGVTSTHSLPTEFIGYINLKAWACIVPFSIMAAPLGVRLSHHLSTIKLRRFFAGFVFILATKMLWDVVRAAI